MKYEFLQWDYKEREFVVSNSGSLLPDANGFVTLKDRIKGNDRNYALTIYQGKDSLKTNQDNRYVPYNNEKDDKTTPPDFEKGIPSSISLPTEVFTGPGKPFISRRLL